MKWIDALTHLKVRRGMLAILLASMPCLFASCALISGPTITLPEGVVSLHVMIQEDPTQRVHFETEYQIKDGPLTNVKPDAGTEYEDRVSFRGKIIPLSINEAGSFAIPISYGVAIMPDGSTWMKQIFLDEPHDLGGGDTLYRVKRRPQEKGLVFVLLPEKGKCAWIYPSKEKPFVPSSLPVSYTEHSEKIRIIEIPPLSMLQTIKPSEVPILSKFHSNSEETE